MKFNDTIDKLILENNIIVETAFVPDNAYPYGSKCPVCGAATISTARTMSPDAPESCKKGHKYKRYEAIKVE